MSKNQKAKLPKQEKELSREEQLERENELLRLENAYLKKLKAFQENVEYIDYYNIKRIKVKLAA